MFNHAISITFSLVDENQDPINKDNLVALIEAAQKRLNNILKDEDFNAFECYDSYEEDHLSRQQG
jgi:hypothetical protein